MDQCHLRVNIFKFNEIVRFPRLNGTFRGQDDYHSLSEPLSRDPATHSSLRTCFIE